MKGAPYILLLSLCPSLVLAQVQQCHVRGQCEGLLTGITGEEAYNDCLQTCKYNPDCSWFTFTGRDECFQYRSCPSIDSGCSDCLTGEKRCEPESATCDVQGLCEGFVIAYNTTHAAHQCLLQCQQLESCHWYTYFQETKTCMFFEDCASIDESCGDCITGQRECYEDVTLNTLMVVGGAGANHHVEVIDLNSANATCPQMPKFPGANFGSVGAFIDGKAIACGGYESSVVDRCFTYNPITVEWDETVSMTDARHQAASVQLSPTEWWITGGNNSSFTAQSSTMKYTAGEGFLPYVSLPEAKYGHHIIQINDTHYALLGGSRSTSKGWIINISGPGEWKLLPDMLEARSGAQAGVVTYPEGHQAIVVAGGGGKKTSEIFDLTDWAWRTGPDLPIQQAELWGGGCVQYGDTFLILSGNIGINGGGNPKFILSFDPPAEAWVELPQKLTYWRYHMAAFLVPNNLIGCN